MTTTHTADSRTIQNQLLAKLDPLSPPGMRTPSEENKFLACAILGASWQPTSELDQTKALELLDSLAWKLAERFGDGNLCGTEDEYVIAAILLAADPSIDGGHLEAIVDNYKWCWQDLCSVTAYTNDNWEYRQACAHVAGAEWNRTSEQSYETEATN